MRLDQRVPKMGGVGKEREEKVDTQEQTKQKGTEGAE